MDSQRVVRCPGRWLYVKAPKDVPSWTWMRNALLCLGMWTAVHAQFTWWTTSRPGPLHCAYCHHNGGRTLPLLTYEDAFFTAFMDLHVMQDGEMAAVAGSIGVQPFRGGERASDEDVACLRRYNTAWLTATSRWSSSRPEFGSRVRSGEPGFCGDFDAYTLQSDGEEYRWFVVSTDFEETKYIQAVEVIPGFPAPCTTPTFLSTPRASPPPWTIPSAAGSTGHVTHQHDVHQRMAARGVAGPVPRWMGYSQPPGRTD